MLKLKKIPTAKNHEGMDMPMMGEYPPTLHLTGKQVPEIKDWDVGEEYEMVVRVKQTSKSENKDGMVDASFEVTAYKAMDEMSDSDMEYMQAEGLKS